jgi:hypothetical protein
MELSARNSERSFTVELKSKAHLRSIAVTNAQSEGVLIEGALGELQQVRFVDGVILEVVGANGVLRLDIWEDEITRKPLKEEGGEIKQ